MYRGKKCVLERRDSDAFIFKDAATLTVKSRKDMTAFLEDQLLQARKRAEDLEAMAQALRDDAASTGILPKVKRYPPGASGAADAHPMSPKPVPLPEQEDKPRAKKRRSAY